MGGHVSRLECVDLKELPADVYESIVSETYTVIRHRKNEGDLEREEEGWKIIRKPEGNWPTAHASKNKLVWRFHLTNGYTYNDPEFLYGWRRIESFWPTRLTTKEEREVWFAWLLSHVETLKTPM